MQTIVSQLDLAFRSAITAAFGVEADPLLGASQNEKFADYQSNAAMGLAKVVSEKTGQKTNPRAVAEQIKAKLAELGLLGEMAQEVTIAGPGFINVRLSPAWLAKQLGAIAPDPRLGIDKTAHSQRVVVDYSGPNVAKQMHVGHLRSSIIGDAISRVIEFQGHEVIRQN
ncbi:MAG: arginyl-tRNA synthetase, partial [Phycisphaerales bacterium]|nr:arginyl-tRNA synthetase [Phycisphaerales bacterium]